MSSKRGWLRRLFGGGPEPPPAPEPPVFEPSPVPWISDEVWAHLHRDATFDPQPSILAPEPYVVTEGDRKRAPILPVDGGEVPPPGTAAEHEQRLRSTPAAPFAILSPLWPICCERLTTLVLLEGGGRPSLRELELRVGRLDLPMLEGMLDRTAFSSTRAWEQALKTGRAAELAELRAHDACDGVLLLQCRACGRVYLGHCHP